MAPNDSAYEVTSLADSVMLRKCVAKNTITVENMRIAPDTDADTCEGSALEDIQFGIISLVFVIF
jgi:hypothetical protein